MRSEKWPPLSVDPIQCIIIIIMLAVASGVQPTSNSAVPGLAMADVIVIFIRTIMQRPAAHPVGGTRRFTTWHVVALKC
uniref:Putative secreted protein n=1 Tax=Anopheles marajoara TaxID=58244 RepID=A0A2M4CC37_9DIPT